MPPQQNPPAEPREQQLPATAPTQSPVYGSDGRLTRAGMEQAIKAGGSVIVDGKHICKVEDLPSLAQHARTEDQKAAARQTLEEQRRKLDDELASLAEPEKDPKAKK